MAGAEDANPRTLEAAEIICLVNNPGPDAIAKSLPGLVEGSSLRVVDLPHLIALKLYAGGPKSRLDVMELLARNPALPRSEVAVVCERFGLKDDWERLISELRD